VVPSGIGTLNIMTRKQTAASTASVGTLRVLTRWWTLVAAAAITGRATTKPTTQVCGLK
jgi:hypothetical protein